MSSTPPGTSVVQGTQPSDLAHALEGFRIGRSVQIFCIWSGLAMGLFYTIFFFGVAGFVPPPPPIWGPERVAQFYAENRTGIRVGQLGALVSSTLLFPFWAVVTSYIARIERRSGRFPVLALSQFGCAVMLQVTFVYVSMLWIIAAFRPELEPSTLRAINDAGWLTFIMVFPGVTIQMFSVAIASFMDGSEDRIWPRWFAYLSIWVGISAFGGAFIEFFYQGAFAWDGVIGWWLALSMFGVWVVIVTFLMHKHFTREEASRTVAETDPLVAV